MYGDDRFLVLYRILKEYDWTGELPEYSKLLKKDINKLEDILRDFIKYQLVKPKQLELWQKISSDSQYSLIYDTLKYLIQKALNVDINVAHEYAIKLLTFSNKKEIEKLNREIKNYILKDETQEIITELKETITFLISYFYTENEEINKQLDEIKLNLRNSVEAKEIKNIREMILNIILKNNNVISSQEWAISIYKFLFIVLITNLKHPDNKDFNKKVDEFKRKVENIDISTDFSEIQEDIKQLIAEYKSLISKIDQSKYIKEVKNLIIELLEILKNILIIEVDEQDIIEENIDKIRELIEDSENIDDIREKILSFIYNIKSNIKDRKNNLNKVKNELTELKRKVVVLEEKLKNTLSEMYYDPLTKVYNRRALEENLPLINKEIQDLKIDYCIAFIDLDNFKHINDNYGHQIGDIVLKKIVSIIKAMIPSGADIYRYGGDEFLVLFKDIKKDNAKIILSSIKDKVSSLKFKYNDKYLNVTLSIGLMKVKDDIYKAIDEADKLMYESKKHGKNRLVVK